MAVQVTMFQAVDGTQWRSLAEAEKRDALIAACEAAVKPMGPRVDDKGCKFGNGAGYVQHTREAIESTKNALIDIARTEWPTSEFFAKPYGDILHNGIVGRILDDSNHPLSKYWNRLHCIDQQWREWGQPYFAWHPDQGEQFEIAR